MSWGTKIGLLLVLVLCGIGGYFVYQKIQNPTVIVETPPPLEPEEDLSDLPSEEDEHEHAHGHEFDEKVRPVGRKVVEAPPPKQHRGYGPRRDGSRGGFNFDDLDKKDAPAPEGQSEPQSDPFQSNDSDFSRRRNRRDQNQDKPEIVTFDDDLEEIKDGDKPNFDKRDNDFESFGGSERPDRGGRFDDQFAGGGDDRRGGRRGSWGGRDDKDDPFDKAPEPLNDGKASVADKKFGGDSDFEDFSAHDGRDFGKNDFKNDATNGATADKSGNNHGIAIDNSGRRSRWGNHYRNEAPLPEDDAPDALDADVLEPIPAHNHSASHSPTTSPGDTSHFGNDAPSPFQGSGGNRHGGHGHFGMMKDMQWHVVEQNDSFWSIAKKVYNAGSYFNALAAFNQERIPDPRKMRPGMKVMVPPKQVLEQKFPQLIATLPTAGAGGVQQSGFHTTGSGPQNAACDVQTAGFFVGPQGQPSYRIGKSDTLSNIAQTHLGRASRWSQIYEMNRQLLQTPHSLQVGMVLQLPSDASNVALANEGRFAR